MTKRTYAILFIGLLLIATAAMAVPPYGVSTEYYTDATFDEAVGGVFMPGDCCPLDEWFEWGETSNFRKKVTYDYCDRMGAYPMACHQYVNGVWQSIPCS